MSKTPKKEKRPKYAIHDGEVMSIQLTESFAVEGKLVEQDDESLTVVTKKNATVIIPQSKIMAIWIEETEAPSITED